jgi:hypothetical protein
MIRIYGSFMVLEFRSLDFGTCLELGVGWKWKFGTIWWKVGVRLELIRINLNSIQIELR